MLQRAALEKLHHDERTSILLADFVDGADVGMVERGGGLRLALESFQSLAVARHFIRQEFQRDEAVQGSVFGFIHYTHSAAAEFFEHPVVRNHPPRK